MVEAGDFASLFGCFRYFKKLAVHAGADKELAVVLKQTKDQCFFPKDLAHRSVSANAVKGILAITGRHRRGRENALRSVPVFRVDRRRAPCDRALRGFAESRLPRRGRWGRS